MKRAAKGKVVIAVGARKEAFSLERGEQGEVVVRVHGVLNAASVREIAPLLHAELRLVLDLCRAADVEYYGLSALVAEALRSDCAVVLRGLCDRHIRMLRYFGADMAHLGLDEERWFQDR